MEYFSDLVFDNISGRERPLAKGEYEACTFRRCDLQEFNLDGFKFVDCLFEDCNISLIRTGNTSIQSTKFINCKLLGIHFEKCNTFNLSFSFQKCQLNHSSFYQLKIKKTFFQHTQLREVDFTECDLGGSTFDDCDLTDATFEKTNAEQCDFSKAFGYTIDPETNRIARSRFSVMGLGGLLTKYNIKVVDTVT